MPGPEQTATASAYVRIERMGAAAIVTLNRPDALNALSIAMRATLSRAVAGFGRDPGLYAVMLRSEVQGAFSVGGDVREMTGLAVSDMTAARKGLADELALCWILECLSKPMVSFVDGRVMGTGVGISLYNTHRVAGEAYRFSMPETQIGYFPDCGVVHAFARMPHAIGHYLGLTGRAIGPADAYALGLATHCIPSTEYGRIEALLADADPVDPILDAAHIEPGPSPLLADASTIERFFGAASLRETVGRLEAAKGEGSGFAAETLALLSKRSPIALAVTDRMIRAARHLDIREALMQDYRLAHRFVDLGDFREGVRAHLIDKDGTPSWSPARLEDVTTEMLDALFAPLGEQELKLATRQEMQAARV